MKKLKNWIRTRHFARTWTAVLIVMVCSSMVIGVQSNYIYELWWHMPLRWVGLALFGIASALWWADFDARKYRAGHFDKGAHWWRASVRIVQFTAMPLIVYGFTLEALWASLWAATWFGIFFDPLINIERKKPADYTGSEDLYSKITAMIFKKKKNGRIQLAIEVIACLLSILSFYFPDIEIVTLWLIPVVAAFFGIGWSIKRLINWNTHRKIKRAQK